MVVEIKITVIIVLGMMATVGGTYFSMPDDASVPQKDETAPVSRVLPASWEYPLYYANEIYEPPYETGLLPAYPNLPEKMGDTLTDASSTAKDDDGFVVRWEGTDDIGGSGLDYYDVQVRYENGLGEEVPWTDWKTHSTATYGMYYPDRAGTYYFRCRAGDVAGNVEEWPDSPDTWFVVTLIHHVQHGPMAPVFAGADTGELGDNLPDMDDDQDG